MFPINWESWDIYWGINYSVTCDDDIANLSGARLVAYLVNNYLGQKNKYKHSLLDGECFFTGFCGDEDLIDPIREFMLKPTEKTSFADLLSACLESWLVAVRRDYESQQEDEYIAEYLTANEYEYLENGNEI